MKKLACFLVLSAGSAIAVGADYGIGFSLLGDATIRVPIEIQRGNYVIEPSAYYWSYENSLGENTSKNYDVDFSKKIETYGNITTYIGSSFGIGSTKSGNIIYDTSSGSVFAYSRKYEERRFSPNVKVTFNFDDNIVLGGQVGISVSKKKYEYDTYTVGVPLKSEYPDYSTESEIFLRYMFK